MVKAGEKYRHFKGGEYEVLWVARDCENLLREVVVYKSLYVSKEFPIGTVWARSLDDFVGEKIFDDGKKVKRFELVE